MDIEVTNEKGWAVVSIPDRVDAFNYEKFCSALNQAVADRDCDLAFELEGAEFMSFKSIKYISTMASELNNKGRNMALLAPSEKLKRQFDIFASLDGFDLYRSRSDWENKTQK